GEASGQLLSKFAAPNDAMRKATNRATPDKYFFIPLARFHETYAADLSASDAQFLADSQQQLAETALGAPVSVAAWRTKPSYAILTTQDHVTSASFSAGCISVRAPRSPKRARATLSSFLNRRQSLA